MTLRKALVILMNAATRDVKGAGLGFRSTSDAQRVQISQAWARAYRYVYKCEPDENAYFNAGMSLPREVRDAIQDAR